MCPASISNQNWIRLPLGSFYWLAAPEFESQELLRYLKEPITLIQPPARLLKEPAANSGSRVFKLEDHRVSRTPLVIKSYEERRLWTKIKVSIRGSRAHRAFRWAYKLRQLGIPTIIPVAAGSARFKPWLSYFVMLEVTSAPTLLALAREVRDRRRRRRLISGLAKILAQLHDAGISYGDAHLANFLVSGEIDHPQLVMIDLDGLRHFFRITLKRAARDLRRLIKYSPTTPVERFRFLIEYARSRRHPMLPRRLMKLLPQDQPFRA